MDLADFDTVEEGVFYQLLNPRTGEPEVDENGEPAGLMLIGADSEGFRARQNQAINKRLKRGRKLDVTAEAADEEAIELLSGCIVGFKNLSVSGKPLEYSRENARMVLRKYPFIRDQVNEAVADRTRFFKASQQS